MMEKIFSVDAALEDCREAFSRLTQEIEWYAHTGDVYQNGALLDKEEGERVLMSKMAMLRSLM